MTLNYTATIQDNTPPVLDVETPEDETVVNELQVEVSGTATDDSRVAPTVTVNDIEVEVDPETGEFSGLIPIEAEEEVILTFVATDGANNTTIIERTIFYDIVPPEILLSEPDNGITVYTPTVAVSGTASDNRASPPAVTINGDAVVVEAGTGAFSDDAVLVPGLNLIEVVASDGANEVSETRSVTFEVTELTLTVLYPEEGAVTSETSALVEGYAADGSGLPPVVTINGEPAEVDPLNFTFSETVALDPGPNAIVVFADNGYEQAEVVRNVISDPVPPELVILSPEDGILVNETPIVVSGVATDDLGVPVVTINGEPVEVDPVTGAFEGAVDLVAGQNTITVVCADAVSKVQESRTVTFDDLAPILLILYPLDGYTTTADSVLVVGFAMDDQADPPSVEINGENAYVDPLLYSFAHDVPLEMGPNTIEVKASDGINEENSVRTIIRQ